MKEPSELLLNSRASIFHQTSCCCEGQHPNMMSTSVNLNICSPPKWAGKPFQCARTGAMTAIWLLCHGFIESSLSCSPSLTLWQCARLHPGWDITLTFASSPLNHDSYLNWTSRYIIEPHITLLLLAQHEDYWSQQRSVFIPETVRTWNKHTHAPRSDMKVGHCGKPTQMMHS